MFDVQVTVIPYNCALMLSRLFSLLDCYNLENEKTGLFREGEKLSILKEKVFKVTSRREQVKAKKS